MATLKERESGKTKSENSGSGIGYLFGKAYEGFAGAMESATDFVGSGVSKLLGDEQAARIYYELDDSRTGEADYRFNPDDSWKMAGDVAQGIGNSLPMMAAGIAGGAAVGGIVGAAGLTGTAANIATGVGRGIVTFTSSFLSAAGSGVQEAYQKTGKLDDKAWKSGITSGIIEGATETLVDPILGGTASGAFKLGSKIAGTAATAAAKRFSSKIGVQIAKDLAGSFVSEALEEGVSAILTPIANNIIYQDEIARGEMEKETLDWHDIGYQMLVGGLSGVIMGGANTIVSESVSTARGAEAIRAGKVDQIMQSAQEILNAYSGDETMTKTDAYKRLQNALQNAEKAKGLAAARYVAEVQESSAAVALSDQVVTSARQILTNPEAVATRINQFSLKDTDGNTISVTAEEIRNSVKNGNLAEALSEDGNILRKLAVLDAAGRMYADTQAYESAVERGEYLGDRADVAHFLQTASTEEVQAVNNALGLDIATASYEDIRDAFVRKSVDATFGGQPGSQQSQQQNRQASLTAQEAQNSAQERTNGAEPFADTTEAKNATEQKKRAAKARAETEKTLSENVSQWDRMPSRNRTLVRQTYTQAVNNGYSAEDALTFARLSAKAGINIEFTENGMQTASGDTVDGYYDREENVIVVNPKSKKPFESLLIHELTHSLEGTTRYGRVMDQSLKSLSETERNRIIALYQPVTQGKSAAEKVEILSSEYTAHYTEKALKSKKFLEALVKEDRTIADRIRSFFEQRFGDEKLDRNARKLAKAYEKAFSEMAQRNFGANAVSSSYSEENFGSEQYSLSTWRENTVLTPDGRRSNGRDILAAKLKESGRSEKEISALLAQVDKVADVVADLSKEFSSIKDFAGIVPYYRPRADGKGYEPMLRCVVKNGEYELNIDFTTICKKRESLSRFLTEYQESGRSFGEGFTQEAQAYLHNLFKKYDLDTACTFCFVESRRVNVNSWSNKVSSLWNKALKDAGITNATPISSVSDVGKIDIINGITDEIAFDVSNLIEPAAQAAMEASAIEEYDRYYASRRTNPDKRVSPNTEERMREYIKNHAKDGKIFSFDKSDLLNVRAIAYFSAVAPDFYSILLTAYGANAPKMTLPAAPYASDLFYNPQFDRNDIAERAFAVGGVRINSFSDFQISRILDYVQFVADAEAQGLPVQTYVKELAMVEILGKSKLKGNMSLIPEVDKTVDKDHAGLDKNGNYIFSSDSVDFNRAVELQEREGIKGYWGTILVGISKYQILTALGDPRIKMIIPYHRSGMPKALHHYYNHTLYTDYTNYQNTKDSEGKKLKNDPFLQVFYESYRKNGGDYLTATQDYLQYCKDNNLIPRFAMKWSSSRSFEENFNDPENYILNHPNYYKVLIDFTSDGGLDANGKQIFVQQTAVKLDLEGIDVEAVTRRDAKLLEKEIESYEQNKGAMFDAFESALNGKKIDAKEQKAIRDARISEENKTRTFAPQGGRQLSVSSNESSVARQGRQLSISAAPNTRSSVLSSRTSVPQQSVGSRIGKAANRFEIDFINEFAGIEDFLKKSGVEANDIASAIQSARNAYARGQSQIGYGVLDSSEMRKKGGDITIKQPGLQKIFADIRDKGDEYTQEFSDYLLHMHNVDRMSLEEKSKQTLATLEQIRDIMKSKDAKSDESKKKIAELKKQIRFFAVEDTPEGVQRQIDNFEIEENKPVFGNNQKEKELLDESIKMLQTEKARILQSETETKKRKRDLKNINKRLEYLLEVRKNYVERKEAVTAEQSKAVAEAYESKHPEFRAKAEQVWAYSRQINRNRANDGLISAEDAEYYEEKYPHYVPTFRESYMTGISPIRGKNNIAVKQTVSAAEGGGGTIAPLDESLAKQTLAATRAGSVNIIANMIYDAAMRGETDEVEIVSRKQVTSSEAYDANYEEETPKNNEITFYRDGEKITMRVSREIFAGFDAVNGTIDFQNPAMTFLQRTMKVFKSWVTTYNPLFVIWNKLRDVQDAGFNTKYGLKFGKLLFSGRAEREIKANSKLWQAFVAAGGMTNTAYDVNEGFQRGVGERGFIQARKNLFLKAVDMINIANDFVEQTTRFTEFICSIEAGNSVEQAIVDSQEVTTNFGRKGRIAKKFNATISPFLNPSIQGFDKIVRNVKDATKSKKAFLALLFKVAILGIAPQLLNEFLHGFDDDDDDEYDELSDYVKTNNYLFKVGDVFIRIPKGRISAAIAGAVVQTTNAIEGRNVDVGGYIENTLSQMSPVENATRTIFSPITDVIANRSWSGGTIESRKFENVAPEYRYDDRTSAIAIALGKVLKVSPKKIHYLLDQYTGVFGDIILPATSAAAQKDMFSARMTVDPVSSNRLSGDFYKLYDDTNYAKNDPKASEEDRKKAADQTRFLNRVKDAVSDLQQQKTEIQNSDKSRKEKLEETRVVQALINEAYRQAFAEFDSFSEATGKYLDIEKDDERFAFEMRDAVGAEAALKNYDSDVYDKSVFLKASGVPYEDYFDFYFTVKHLQSDKDKNGETISGTLRAKVLKEIRKLKLTTDQKLLILASRGYTAKDGDIGGLTAESAQKRLLAYVRRVTSGMSKEEKKEFAKMFGMKLKNNLIFL